MNNKVLLQIDTTSQFLSPCSVQRLFSKTVILSSKSTDFHRALRTKNIADIDRLEKMTEIPANPKSDSTETAYDLEMLELKNKMDRHVKTLAPWDLWFDQREKPKIPYDDFRKDHPFWLIYPREVQRWMKGSQMPRGRYNYNGKWEATGVFDQSQIINPVAYTGIAKSASSYERFAIEPELKSVPPDLVGAFRFGITKEELDELNICPQLREVLSIKNASSYEVKKYRKEQAIKMWAVKQTDTGTPACQITALTERIKNLSNHFLKNKKDLRSRRDLDKLVLRRHKLMMYLKRRDGVTYVQLIDELNLRDVEYHLVDPLRERLKKDEAAKQIKKKAKKF